uniref:Exosome complex component RRP45 n=1 Tax=Heterorhabditis bacteriophora TaxID=37862 RepID=A0A1I7X1J6_HETBA
MSLVGRMRPLRCELNFLDKADGSCSYSQGKTVVWASCSGPGDVHVTRRENEKMHLDVSFRQLTGDCQHHPLNRVLEATLENTVNTHLFPKTSLVIISNIAVNICLLGYCALLTSRWKYWCRSTDGGRAPFCGVQVVRIGEQFVIDPDQKTEDKADANFLFAFQMSSEVGV